MLIPLGITPFQPIPQLGREIPCGSSPYPTAQPKDSNGFSERLLDEMAIPEVTWPSRAHHVFFLHASYSHTVANLQNPFEAGSMNQTIERDILYIYIYVLYIS